MSDIPETKQCTNCKLEILSGNYIIHSVHCQRHFYLCTKCEQPVNNSDRAEHDKTDHLVINCSNCQLELEKYLLDDHLTNDCPDRKIKCQICDIDVKATDIAEHENYCGSRTEKCPECGEYVMLKYKSLHIDSNHAFIKLSDEPGPSPSWQYGQRTLFNFMPDLSTQSSKPVSIRKRKSCEHFRRSRNSESSESKDDFDEVITRNFNSSSSEKNNLSESKIGSVFETKDVKRITRKDLGEWPALSSLRSLQISEDNPAALNTSGSRQTKVNEESDVMVAMQVSQEINSDIWRKEVSKEGETWKNCFKPFAANELSTEKFVEKSMFEKSTKNINHDHKSDILRNDFNYLYKHESVKLPCEFCGNLFVSNDLILHQSRCSFFMTDTYNTNDRNTMLHFDEDLEQKLPCELCKKFYRLSVLENHQLHCQRNPMKSFKNQDKGNYSKNLKAMNMKSEQGLQNGLEPSTPQLTRMGTRSEWLSELSKSSDEGKNVKNNLNQPESGAITRTAKVSRKTKRAPSPPRR